MDNVIKEENQVLNQKREMIKEAIDSKKNNIEDVEKKVNSLRKEAKGSYNEEKETNEKILNLLTSDIESYEEAMKTPYFGRVDFREYKGLSDTIYIGKKGISNNDKGEEVVVDWRAPIADLYYSGTGGYAYYKSPNGIIEGELELKRKFVYKDDKIDQVFDEGINELIVNAEEGQELVDEFLKINLEENTGKKLKEVVATIQKEQNEIIRWPKNLPIIVQGSAGSGKTTIALHRLAYLIYRYSDTIKGKNILVLAPNKLFLDYISDILPSLGAQEVNQNTFEGLVMSKLKIKGKIYSKDEKLKDIMEMKDEKTKKLMLDASTLKGSVEYKEMIDRYIALVDGTTLDIKDICVCNEVLFERKEIMRLYLKDMKSFPINKRKDEIKRYFKLKIKDKLDIILNKIDSKYEKQIIELRKSEEPEIEKRQKFIAIYGERDAIKNNIKSKCKTEFEDYFKKWRGIDSKDIYYNFLNDEDMFYLATGGNIPEDLAEYIREDFNKKYEQNIIDEDDLASLAYIRILLEGILEKEKYEHIVIDEAQDYSPFQVKVVSEFAKSNSITLVGDLAQGIYYYKGIKTWSDIIDNVFNGKATYVQLTQSYRSTVEIIDYAKTALESQNLGLKDAKPVLRHGEKPKVIKINDQNEYISKVEDIIKEVKDKGKNSIAIITKNAEDAKIINKVLKKSKYKFELVKGKEKSIKNELIIIPSYLTKGLEFDCSIIFNPTNEKYKENLLDERLLYVSLTRALHLEYVLLKDSITNLIK